MWRDADLICASYSSIMTPKYCFLVLLRLFLVCELWERFLTTGQDYGICDMSDVTLADDFDVKGNITSDGYPKHIPAKAWNSVHCRQSVVACPECRIILRFTELQLPQHCPHPDPYSGCIHQCDHLYIFEPDYPEQTTKYLFGQNEGDTYRSQTRRISLVYCSSTTYNAFQKRFRIQYYVEERREQYIGSTPENGTFTSPNFPIGYSRNSDVYQYYLHSKNGFIRLSFDDWNLAPNSKITVYIHNSTKTDRYLTRVGSGERPFVISSGPDLIVKFETGSHDVYDTFNYMGFKAKYEFVSANYWIDKPYHDCGEYYHSLAGGFVEYDGTTRCWVGDVVECLWVVFKYARSDHLVLRIDSAMLNGEDDLEIRRGNHSGSPLLVPGHMNIAGAEYISDDAFYIKLRARCYENRHFKAIFTSYSNSTYNPYSNTPWFDCPSKTQHACHNGRCIESTLVCDGSNHCGDLSDERGCTTPVSTTPVKCSTHLLCRSGEWYCIQKRCDGYIDCKDGSDELNCNEVAENPTASSGAGNQVFSAYHWGTIIPIILICIVLAVIACITVSYYTRRKQRSRRRRNRRSSTATSSNAAAAALPTVTGGLGLGGLVPPRYSGLDAPPTYEESLRFNLGEGVLNLGYRTDSMDYLAQPPPYTPTSDEPLPVRYVLSPGGGTDEERPRARGAAAASPDDRVHRGGPAPAQRRLPSVPMYREPPGYSPGRLSLVGYADHPARMLDELDEHSPHSSATSTMESRSSIGPVSMLSISSSDSSDSGHSVHLAEHNRNPLGAHHSFNSSMEGNASEYSCGDLSPEPVCGHSAADDAEARVESSSQTPPPSHAERTQCPRPNAGAGKQQSNTNLHTTSDQHVAPSSTDSQHKLDSSKENLSTSTDVKPARRKLGPPIGAHDESCDSLKYDEDLARSPRRAHSGLLQAYEPTLPPSNPRRAPAMPRYDSHEEHVTFESQQDATFV